MNSIVINSKQLSAAVKALAPIAAKGYFTDILLEVESNTATITATSLDVTAKKTIELPFANSANFATAVPSQLLNDLLQKLPDQQLTVELLENDIKNNVGKWFGKIIMHRVRQFPIAAD